MKQFKYDSILTRKLLSSIQRYDHEKYWKLRSKVVDDRTVGLLKKVYYLYYLKRSDSWSNCSFGTHVNSGASFQSPPNLPHGPNGIIIGHDTVIGSNCTIFHQVTISHGGVCIGDNVLIGAGSKILKGVKIGNNCKIGANCVVVENIPDNCTVVLPKPIVIDKSTCK